MGINKAKEIIHEAKVKIMELPYFEEKVEVVGALLELEWKFKEQKSSEYIYEDEIAEEVFNTGHEEPWS